MEEGRQAANVGTDETKGDVATDETTTDAADTTASTTQGASNGKGHTKELPSASDHGQQIAAIDKDAEHGPAGGQSEAENPSHPAHPAHPSNPSAPKRPTAVSTGGCRARRTLAGAGGPAWPACCGKPLPLTEKGQELGTSLCMA